MKLTKTQLNKINKAKELEKEYGFGNVFIRWINDYWKHCFIIHKKGEETFKPLLNNECKINEKIINSLVKKELFEMMDINHVEQNNSNDCMIVGCRIKTEIFK